MLIRKLHENATKVSNLKSHKAATREKDKGDQSRTGSNKDASNSRTNAHSATSRDSAAKKDVQPRDGRANKQGDTATSQKAVSIGGLAVFCADDILARRCFGYPSIEKEELESAVDEPCGVESKRTREGVINVIRC